MADLIVICGPQAVGKMTVAECLRDRIHYNLMVNHDSIEVSDRIFGFDTPAMREFNESFRKKVFELAVKHGVDMIFTYVCDFSDPEDFGYLVRLHDLFTGNGGRFFFVELSASLDERLRRNETPHRMERKPSKKDVEWSRRDILMSAEIHKLNTDDSERLFENHIKIDNTYLSPDQVTDLITEAFSLVPVDKKESEYRFGAE